MRELAEFRKDLLALGLHGQLSVSKLSWLLNTRALIRKTKNKTDKIKQTPNHDSTNWEGKKFKNGFELGALWNSLSMRRE